MLIQFGKSGSPHKGPICLLSYWFDAFLRTRNSISRFLLGPSIRHHNGDPFGSKNALGRIENEQFEEYLVIEI